MTYPLIHLGPNDPPVLSINIPNIKPIIFVKPIQHLTEHTTIITQSIFMMVPNNSNLTKQIQNKMQNIYVWLFWWNIIIRNRHLCVLLWYKNLFWCDYYWTNPREIFNLTLLIGQTFKKQTLISLISFHANYLIYWIIRIIHTNDDAISPKKLSIVDIFASKL